MATVSLFIATWMRVRVRKLCKTTLYASAHIFVSSLECKLRTAPEGMHFRAFSPIMVAVQEEQLQILDWLAKSIVSTAAG